MSLTGLIVPSALDMWLMATSLVLGPSSFSYSSISSVPLSSIGTTFRTMPFSVRSICHGTILA